MKSDGCDLREKIHRTVMTWTTDKPKLSKVYIGVRYLLATATMLLAVLGAGCIEDYLRGEAVGRATKREVIQRFGQPMEENHFTDGGSILIYQFQESGLLQKSCREYRLSFNSNEILQAWIKVRCELQNQSKREDPIREQEGDRLLQVGSGTGERN